MSKSLDKNPTTTEGMFKSPDKDWVPPAADIYFWNGPPVFDVQSVAHSLTSVLGVARSLTSVLRVARSLTRLECIALLLGKVKKQKVKFLRLQN